MRKSVANNRYYKKGVGYLGMGQCGRCEVKKYRDEMVQTGIVKYELCPHCFKELSKRKSIVQLFEPAEEFNVRANGGVSYANCKGVVK